MYNIVPLNEREFKRVKDIFSKKTLRTWHELQPYFSEQQPAGSPGSAGSVHEYEYLNNGDMPPEEPWIEDWVSNQTLVAIWLFFNEVSDEHSDFYDYVNYLMKNSNIYEFTNVYDGRSCYSNVRTVGWQRASKKKISKEVKTKLRKYFKVKKAVYYFDNRREVYAIMHPKYGFLVDVMGNIIFDRQVLMNY